MKVAIYIRSASRVADETEQLAQLEEWTRREGYEVVAAYTDSGISGETPFHDRRAARRLLNEIREKNIRVVLVSTLDRLSRSPRGIVTAVEEINDRGAVVRSAQEAFDSGSPTGRLFLNSFRVVADWEAGSEE